MPALLTYAAYQVCTVQCAHTCPSRIQGRCLLHPVGKKLAMPPAHSAWDPQQPAQFGVPALHTLPMEKKRGANGRTEVSLQVLIARLTGPRLSSYAEFRTPNVMQATSFLEWNSIITCLTRCCTNSRDKSGAGDAGYHRIVPSSGAVPPEKRDCSSSDERETSCCQLKHGWAELQAPEKNSKEKRRTKRGEAGATEETLA